jgi:hypothetical protein
MALFEEQENDIFSRNLYDGSFKKVTMAGFKQNRLKGSGNPEGKVQEIQMARSEKTDGKFQEIQVVRTKKYRWQGSMKTGGQDQEIKLARFKKSRWQGSRNTDGKVLGI